jgi:starch-binding outer membrane protein, SusD/RagB family
MKNLIISLLVIFSMVSCTNLEEEVLDTALGDDLLNGDQAAEGVLAPVYANMHQLFNNQEHYFLLQEVSTDECIVPYRGGTDWYNGGRLIEMFRHTWTPNHQNIRLVWQELVSGIAKGLIVGQTLGTDHEYSYEALGMVAFYNLCLLDLYGVALEKDPEDFNTGVLSRVLRGQEAIDYITGILDEIEPELRTRAELGAAGSTRFTLSAAHAVRARLLLNKAVYLDRYATSFTFNDEDMDAVIGYCNQIISSGFYSLETTDYFSIFDTDNHNHLEHIFALDQRLEANGQNRFAWFTLSRNTIGSLEYRSTGTDGGSCTSDFYHTWDGFHSDPRFYKEIIPQDGSVTSWPVAQYSLNRGFLQGQQYGVVLNSAGTDVKKDENGNLVIEMLYNKARTGEAINYTIDVDLEVNKGHSDGVRVLKYEFDPESQTQSMGSVNIPLLRLSDVYLMRAEANLRKGLAPAALTDVNAVRLARGAEPLGSITLDDLYRERGFELYWEQQRRTDMIRFGKYEDTWTSKTSNDKNKRLFPIPQTVIDATSATPDYIVQNPGY